MNPRHSLINSAGPMLLTELESFAAGTHRRLDIRLTRDRLRLIPPNHTPKSPAIRKANFGNVIGY
jgi:hypothetical protein